MNLFLRESFHDCTKYGQVNELFMQRLRDATHTNIYNELMQGYNRHTVTKDWTCNINKHNTYNNKNYHHHHRLQNCNISIKKKHVGN